jgi:hypothetical protein
MEGKKFDNEKLPMELIPTSALVQIAKVLAHGKEKYGEWNWSKGMEWNRFVGAALRHLLAWKAGEDKDPDSGLSHLAHLGACIVFLLTYEELGIGNDNRQL